MINSIDSPDGAGASGAPTLRRFEIFSTVSEAGSIRSASRVLGLTQPAVTHAVRELERSLGVSLFTRGVKGVALTPAGETLLRRTRLLFNELRRTHDEIAELREGTGGRLSIACSSLAAPLMPGALAAFRRERPGVALELHELSWPTADRHWHGGDHDFAVISETGDSVGDGMVREVLIEQALVVLARPGHPHVRARALASLSSSLWLVPSYGRTLLQTLFAQRGMAAPEDVILCKSTHMACSLLAHMDALALMVADMALELNGLVRVPLQGPPLAMVRTTLLVRDPEALTPAARAFIVCLRQSAAALRAAR